jgi:cytochrome c-type biogenesis protein
VLVVPLLQAVLLRATSRLGAGGQGAMARVRSDHPLAQFGLGALMGIAWSPCVGPTLGAAIALAAQGSSLAETTLVMGVFAIAAVVPLVVAGLASRAAFSRHRERMTRIGAAGRRIMGWALLSIGILVLAGIDKQLEAWLLTLAPDWLLDLTTRF